MSSPEGVVSRVTNDLDSYGSYSFGVTRDSTTLVTLQDIFSYQIFAASGSYQTAEQLTHAGVNGQNGVDTDGKKVVFTGEKTESRTIWTTDFRGGGRVAVSESGRFPKLSRDGKSIVFSDTDSHYNTNLWIVGSDGSGLRQLTSDNSVYYGFFAPDGQSVYYSPLAPGFQNVYRMQLSGGTPEKVSELKAFLFDVSPDGQSLIVQYFDEPANRRQTDILSIATGKITQTIELPETAGSQSWMPQGDAIAYVDNRNGVSNIWKMPLKGGANVQVTHFDAEEIASYAFSADGKLVLSRGRHTSDVVLITNFRPR